MDIVAAISKLDAQFKRGQITAGDYAWELQLLTSSKVEELATTYTIVHMVDGEVCGKSKESTLAEVKETTRCYRCEDDTDFCPCDQDGFISELEANGKAMRVERDSFGTTVIIAYKNRN